jgi:FkbH-like protein
MNTAPADCLLIADFTVSGLVPFLRAAQEPPVLAAEVAPFDQVRSILLDASAPTWQSNPQMALVWTRPQAAIGPFGRFLQAEPVPTLEILEEVDRFAQCLRTAASRVGALFVASWTMPAYQRGLGLLNLDSQVGPAYQLLRMNARLIEAVAGDRNIHVLDAGRWVALAGQVACSPKLWHLSKIAFGPEVFKHAAADIKAAVRALKGQTRKLVVLDLDDTLWGGIVGDVGWENLKLGGHDPVGEAFQAFQRSLKALSRRGIALGVVSKNSEAIALEAIDRHPEMILRRDDFAAWRINWQDKVQNLVELVADVNVGLDAVVFIDDNPAERGRVREALPEVLVPDWPPDKLLYQRALEELTCFDSIAISNEDRRRSRTYAAERQRREAARAIPSVEEYLQSLGLKVIVERLGPANLVRAAQLLNKTNQMNLATRRMTEAQFLAWAQGAANHAFVFRVADRFDDYGLTGIATLSVVDGVGRVADFVLSCRVLGRGVEHTMLHVLAQCGQTEGARQLLVIPIPTSRNAPCLSFFGEQSGLVRPGEADGYTWDLAKLYPAPTHVQITGLEGLDHRHAPKALRI